MPSLFTRIINRELPAKIFYETEDVIVIADINPKAEIHLLLIPKKESIDFYQTDPETLIMLNETVKKVATRLGVEDYFRIVINNGFGQEVDHLHYHFLSPKHTDKLCWIN